MKKLGLWILTVAGTLAAVAPEDLFDEVYFDLPPDTRMLVLSIASPDHELPYLFPSDLQATYTASAAEYQLAPVTSSSNSLFHFRVAPMNSKISADCRQEVQSLLQPGKAPLDQLTTGFWIRPKSPVPTRVAMKAGQGLKLNDVSALISLGTPGGASLTRHPDARYLLVSLEYEAPPAQSFSPWEFHSTLDEQTGQFRLEPEPEGLAILRTLGKGNYLTEPCRQSLQENYLTRGESSIKPTKKETWTLLRLPANAPDRIEVIPAAPLKVLEVEQLY